MLKSKLEFKIQIDSPTTSKYYKSHWIYGVSLGRIHYHISTASEYSSNNKISPSWIKDKRSNKTWRNITPNKTQGMGAIEFIYSSIGLSVGDPVNEHDKCIFLPSYSQLGYTSSLTGVKVPNGAQYPAYIDFDSIGFKAQLLAYKGYANKNNIRFSQAYKQHLIKSTSTILARYLTKQDKLYLNPIDFNFYNIEDNSLYTGYIPDEHIFRPFNTGDIQKTKQQILREWTDFKYFGSNMALPKFVPNEEKKQNYFKSLVSENEEFISMEKISYDNMSKEDLTKLVLIESLANYYDFNDDLIFTIDNKNYRLDIENEQFLDEENNILPYIAIYDENKKLERILSFKEYRSMLKETFTDDDALMQQELIQALKDSQLEENKDKVLTSLPNQYTNIAIGNADRQYSNFTSGWCLLHKFLDSYSGGPGFSFGLDNNTSDCNLYYWGVGGLSYVNYEGEVVYNNGSITIYPLDQYVEIYRYPKVLFYMLRDNIYTNIENIDLSKADYNSITTYFYERGYIEGDEFDTVVILPIFIIAGVTATNTYTLPVKELRYEKKILKDDEINEDTNYEIDNDGNKYQIEVIGEEYDPPQEFEIYTPNEDGTDFIVTKELMTNSSIPKITTIDKEMTDYVRFRLPMRRLKIYSKVSNYIKKLKNGEITGYLLKYKDLTDNKIKVRVHNEDSISYLKNISDITYDIAKCLPIIPLWTQICTLDAIKAGITSAFNPASWFATSGKKNGVRNNNFLGYYTGKPREGFYQFYDKKINKFYKDALNFYLIEWEQQINGKWTDEQYGVKMKKLSNRFKNEKSILYSKSIFDKPTGDITSYDELQQKGSLFGYHTAIRMNFSIYFNKHFRKAKLIAKLGYTYLDYFYKRLNGKYGIEISQILYPNDRVQFAEKRITLKFTKFKYDIAVEGDKASYYCEFDNQAGFFIFYNRTKREKFVFDINSYLPNWRSSYFSGIDTYRYDSKSANKLSAKDRIGLYTITKNDIEPKKYTDEFNPKSNIPTTKYLKVGETYRYDISSIFYNTSTTITYNTDNGYKQRIVNTWRGTADYACFYRPHSNNIDDYVYNDELTQKILLNFEERNVFDYIVDKLQYRSIPELKDIYKKIFNTDINIITSIDENIFNYNGNFDNLVLETVNEDLFKSSNNPQYVRKIDLTTYTGMNDKTKNQNQITIAQAYELYDTFDKQCLLTNDNIDIDGVKSRQVAKDIAYYLLDSGELPITKYITPSEFVDYFVTYKKDGILDTIFTSYEVYQLGFINFLVTNDTDNYELTVLLETIMAKSTSIISNIDLAEGIIEYNSVQLPMPVEVYKRLPIYTKNMVASLMFQVECYNVMPVPSVNTTDAIATRTYKYMEIVFAIVMAIVGIVLMPFTAGQSGWVTAFAIVAIVGAVISIIALVIQLIAMIIPASNARNLMMKASKILSYVGAILSMVGAIGNMGSMSAVQQAAIALSSIDFTMNICNTIAEAFYEHSRDKSKEIEYNNTVERYNQNIDEMNKFIEDNEFEAQLLNQYLPLSYSRVENRLYDDKYDDSIELFINGSLEILYEDLDNYYDSRL